MASSIEGRFPFLDVDVVALANSLPADYKLRVLDEKHVLKRAAADLVTPSILRRPKQPYRAPDALAFTAAAWVPELLAESSVRAAGVFDSRAVGQLWEKCRATERDISNTDNMALVGVISTQLLHRELIASPPSPTKITPRTLIDRIEPA
jgi:asparagine synthase (glutamine-hydrolysing)